MDQPSKLKARNSSLNYSTRRLNVVDTLRANEMRSEAKRKRLELEDELAQMNMERMRSPQGYAC